MKINLSEIRIDGGTQSRVEINEQVVSDYAEAIHAGIRFPEVSLFFDGTTYWLVDGFHRFLAHERAGKKSIDAESRNGTQRDAILYSVGANADHGLRRSNADKRKAVGILLADAEWGAWSDRQIAEACSVSHNFVSELRRSLSSDDSEKRIFTTKHGTQAVMNTANIGRTRPQEGKQNGSGAIESAVCAATSAREHPDTAGTTPSSIAHDAFSGIDLADEQEEKIRNLELELEVLKRDDAKAALAEQVRIRIAAEERLADTMGAAAQAAKDAKANADFFHQMMQITGEKSRSAILKWARQRMAAVA